MQPTDAPMRHADVIDLAPVRTLGDRLEDALTAVASAGFRFGWYAFLIATITALGTPPEQMFAYSLITAIFAGIAAGVVSAWRR